MFFSKRPAAYILQLVYYVSSEDLPGLWNCTHRPTTSHVPFAKNWDPHSIWSLDLQKSFHF